MRSATQPFWRLAVVLVILAGFAAGQPAPALAQDGGPAAPVTLVTTSPLHLRAAPSTAARIYHTIPQATTLTASAISPSFQWLRVSHDGQGGWVARQYLELQTGDTATLTISSDYVPPAVISASTYAGPNDVITQALQDVYIRETPEIVDDDPRTTFKETNVITVLPAGARASVRSISVDGLWVLVEYQTVRGWVRGRFLDVVGGAEGPVPFRPEVPLDGDGIGFVADAVEILPGQCTTLRWSVGGDGSVYYKARTVTSQGSRRECPTQTTRYSLTVVRPGYQIQQRFVTVRIVQPQISFTASAQAIQLNACVTLSWETSSMEKVYYNNELEPTALSGSRQECPKITTTYVLRAFSLTGEIFEERVTVTVYVAPQPGTQVNVLFVPEQSFLTAGQCTNLVWNTSGATHIFYQGQEVGPSGSRQECPAATTTYILRVYTVDNRTLEYQAMVTVN